MSSINGSVCTKWKDVTQADLLKVKDFLPEGARVTKIKVVKELVNHRHVKIMLVNFKHKGEMFTAKIKQPKTGDWNK